MEPRMVMGGGYQRASARSTDLATAATWATGESWVYICEPSLKLSFRSLLVVGISYQTACICLSQCVSNFGAYRRLNLAVNDTSFLWRIAEKFWPSFKSLVEFYDLSPFGANHIFITIWPCHRLQKLLYFYDVFAMLQACYKRLCHVTKMFSADCKSCAIFCYMGEMLSSGCGGRVILVT